MAMSDETARKSSPAGKESGSRDGVERATLAVPFRKWTGSKFNRGEDAIVVEEPIEYRILDRPVATVMRTPGDDRDLSLGFFYCEGWISGYRDVGVLAFCESNVGEEISRSNVVNLVPSPGSRIQWQSTQRLQPVTSSCGVCGKSTIEDVLRSIPELADEDSDSREAQKIRTGVLTGLPDKLRTLQPIFGRTGALHAAGIFDLEGRPLSVREDIGRHNAVDKVIGGFVRRGEVPLSRHVLVVSGRTSFEIVQKALRARIPLVVAVSGVSTLAVDLARMGGLTLCGFTRGRSFSNYTHPHRIVGC